MSHPNPQFDPENSYPNDSRPHSSPVSSFKREMKSIRSGLQKVVGHKRRERHLNAKSAALAKKSM